VYGSKDRRAFELIITVYIYTYIYNVYKKWKPKTEPEKLDLHRDSTLENPDPQPKKPTQRTNTQPSELKSYYLHAESRITDVITDSKTTKTSE